VGAQAPERNTRAQTVHSSTRESSNNIECKREEENGLWCHPNTSQYTRGCVQRVLAASDSGNTYLAFPCATLGWNNHVQATPRHLRN
jgi:hypothetical protein